MVTKRNLSVEDYQRLEEKAVEVDGLDQIILELSQPSYSETGWASIAKKLKIYTLFKDALFRVRITPAHGSQRITDSQAWRDCLSEASAGPESQEWCTYSVSELYPPMPEVRLPRKAPKQPFIISSSTKESWTGYITYTRLFYKHRNRHIIMAGETFLDLQLLKPTTSDLWTPPWTIYDSLSNLALIGRAFFPTYSTHSKSLTSHQISR